MDIDIRKLSRLPFSQMDDSEIISLCRMCLRSGGRLKVTDFNEIYRVMELTKVTERPLLDLRQFRCVLTLHKHNNYYAYAWKTYSSYIEALYHFMTLVISFREDIVINISNNQDTFYIKCEPAIKRQTVVCFCHRLHRTKKEAKNCAIRSRNNFLFHLFKKDSRIS